MVEAEPTLMGDFHMSFAKAIVIGRLGADPVVRDGKENKFTTARIAVNRGSGNDQVTTWFDISVDGDRRSEVLGDARKGDMIYVDGALSTREHEGKTYLRINVDTFRVMTPTEEESAA